MHARIRTARRHATPRLDLDDRSILRPAFSVRRLSARLHKGRFTAEIGRQFIRWGKTDILTPTDRFAPKDYLSSVVDSDFLGVAATRVTYESGGDTIDLVWQPWFTPSRTPLLNQRWTALPPEAAGISIIDAGARYPGGSQYGARWNHVGAGYEYSLCFFDGYNNLPLFSATFNPLASSVALQRYYPQLRLYGGDAAVPLTWFTVKGEAAYFTSSTPDTDEYCALRDSARAAGEGVVVCRRLRRGSRDALFRKSTSIRARSGLRAILCGPRGFNDRRQPKPVRGDGRPRRGLLRPFRILAGHRATLARHGWLGLDSR